MLRYQPELPKLKFAHRLTYNLKANWKNVVDNFLECYHCPLAHPAFVEMIAIKQYRTKTYGIYSSHISPPGRADNSAFTYAEIEGRPNNFSAWWLYPGAAFAAFPGDPNITLLHIMPTGPNGGEHFDFFSCRSAGGLRTGCDRYTDQVLQLKTSAWWRAAGPYSKGYQGGRCVVDEDCTDTSEHGLHIPRAGARRSALRWSERSFGREACGLDATADQFDLSCCICPPYRTQHQQ
jgi:choline monooxygenase